LTGPLGRWKEVRVSKRKIFRATSYSLPLRPLRFHRRLIFALQEDIFYKEKKKKRVESFNLGRKKERCGEEKWVNKKKILPKTSSK
jgi:hypothetical protein